jgi:hypothetical protein
MAVVHETLHLLGVASFEQAHPLRQGKGAAMIEIVLTEDDRELCSIAARVLMALDPGQEREDAGERLLACYRTDLTKAHPGAEPEVLDDMTLGFGAALLLEMERVGLAHATEAESGHA